MCACVCGGSNEILGMESRKWNTAICDLGLENWIDVKFYYYWSNWSNFEWNGRVKVCKVFYYVFFIYFYIILGMKSRIKSSS